MSGGKQTEALEQRVQITVVKVHTYLQINCCYYKLRIKRVEFFEVIVKFLVKKQIMHSKKKKIEQTSFGFKFSQISRKAAKELSSVIGYWAGEYFESS